ncbi:MAG: cysteine peptidase family C39 domain-containing protein [Elainellaceae cyanobacterium]
MLSGLLLTFFLGILFFIWGMRLGRVMLRQGATANDLFKSKTPASLAFLGIYVFLLIITISVPQMQALPLEWRFYGMRISWTMLRVFLLGACGMAFTVSWYTARLQVFSIILVGVLGLAGFSGVESYFLSPIHASLHNNLQSNGVYRQTSDSSCAPAALATLLKYWGISASESDVAELAGTSRLGTTMPQLIVAAQKLDMDGVELQSTWQDMQQINRPGILAVWLFDGNRKLPHAVALLGLTNRVATIADPSRGEIFHLDRSTFNYIWRDQYVPIVRPSDMYLTNVEAAQYLHQLGYLDTPQASANLTKAIRQFQRDHRLTINGVLDSETVLFLTGAFIHDAPRLDEYSNQA